MPPPFSRIGTRSELIAMNSDAEEFIRVFRWEDDPRGGQKGGGPVSPSDETCKSRPQNQQANRQIRKLVFFLVLLAHAFEPDQRSAAT